jgi:NAD(P)-dependent dehydrogenase (short-subunit alcohol dehydrogenase family)
VRLEKNCVAFLDSPLENDFITGACLPVDGGRSIAEVSMGD